jgi:hypothetical protein
MVKTSKSALKTVTNDERKWPMSMSRLFDGVRIRLFDGVPGTGSRVLYSEWERELGREGVTV